MAQVSPELDGSVKLYKSTCDICGIETGLYTQSNEASAAGLNHYEVTHLAITVVIVSKFDT